VILANGRLKCGACDFGGSTKLVHLVGVSISFEKNFYRLPFTPPLSGSPYRSFSVPYLKSDMPRVLLQGEPDSTSFQEKQESMEAFRETIETVMIKHHTAFLNMFK
jgi:hypothetical protein